MGAGPDFTQFQADSRPSVALTTALRSVLHDRISSPLALSIKARAQASDSGIQSSDISFVVQALSILL